MNDPFSPRRIWAIQLDGQESDRLDPDLAERLARVLDLAPELPFLEVQTVSGAVQVSRRFPQGTEDLVERHLQGIFRAAPWIGSIALPATHRQPRRVAFVADDDFASAEPPSAERLPPLAWRIHEHEQDQSRLQRLISALCQSNEAMLRAVNAEDLLARTCEAIMIGGLFTHSHVALLRPGSDDMPILCTAGDRGATLSTTQLSIDPARPEGQGLCGQAYRARQPCISNDYLADPRLSRFHANMRASGSRSSAAFPLMKHGEPVGVLQLFSPEVGAFTADLIDLLSRMVANVSFALENLDRIAAKDRADQALSYLASHDPLTGLMNRAAFSQALGDAIAIAKLQQSRLAMLVIDLDRFKAINDSLGHAEGDVLLVEVARRLSAAALDDRIVARLGGDEFVVLLPQLAAAAEAEKVAAELLSAVMDPFRLGGYDCRTTASIGVALYPEHGSDEQTLMRHAEIALYHAKDGGKNDYRVFVDQPEQQPIERLALEARLTRALAEGELRVHYQPKVDLATGRVGGVEALLRWQDPELGLVPPNRFIPLAEETGLIVPMGLWVLRTACQQHVAWRRAGYAPIPVAVNLSPRQLRSDQLLHDVDDILLETGMPPEWLELEITETAVMQDPERAKVQLGALRGRGISVAMDDFGVGHSSMALLKRFPIDTLKIDRSFIRDLPHDNDDRAIIAAIVAMGKAVSVRIVAEGVETREQLDYLREQQCDAAQGYLFSRPLPDEQVRAVFDRLGVVEPLDR